MTTTGELPDRDEHCPGCRCPRPLPSTVIDGLAIGAAAHADSSTCSIAIGNYTEAS